MTKSLTTQTMFTAGEKSQPITLMMNDLQWHTLAVITNTPVYHIIKLCIAASVAVKHFLILATVLSGTPYVMQLTCH